MAWETVKAVVAYLRKEGVEVSDAAADAAKAKFSGQVLAPSDRVLAEGHVSISKDFNDSKTTDLQALKEKVRKLTASLTETEDALARGDKVGTAKLTTALAENVELKAIAERYMAEQHEAWKQVLALKADEKLPATLLPFYTFAAEGEELTDQQVLANVTKFKEHVAIGAYGEATPVVGPTPAAPKVPPAKGKEGANREPWQGKNPAEKIAYGHAHSEPGSSASMDDVLKGE